MNYNDAKQKFETYLESYDRSNDKVRLKIIHTYGVVHDMSEICHRMHLTEEDTELARIIALLHDIGRFEQLKRFDSFEPTTMDHAAYGVQVLFEEGMIRQFVPEDTWDDLIQIIMFFNDIKTCTEIDITEISNIGYPVIHFGYTVRGINALIFEYSVINDRSDLLCTNFFA